MNKRILEFGKLTNQEKLAMTIIELNDIIDDYECFGMSTFCYRHDFVKLKLKLTDVYYKHKLIKFIFREDIIDSIRSIIKTPVELQDIVLEFIKIRNLGYLF